MCMLVPRGYYKCSMKDCRAKKMVQPTDRNPNIFEVTYVGSHTCSSTSRRRHRSRASAKAVPADPSDPKRPSPSPGPSDVLVQTKIARLLKNQATCSSIPDAIANPNLINPNSANPNVGDEGERKMDTMHESWPENELSDVINDSKEACSAEDVETEELYLDQISSRDEELGFQAFQSDSLLWQEILSTSQREGWHNLPVEM